MQQVVHEHQVTCETKLNAKLKLSGKVILCHFCK